MTRTFATCFVLLSVITVTTSGCATWWGDGKSTQTSWAGDAETEASETPGSLSEYQSRLESLVRRGVAEVESEGESRQSEILYKRPYYYREYEAYPNGASPMEVAIRQTESKTAPYVADVKLDKVRYATRLHRRREEAVSDANFLRDTGSETLTYEFRNGRWMRVGSMFLAEKSEENINGEWVPLEESVQRTIAVEEQEADSWWRRAWGRVTGR